MANNNFEKGFVMKEGEETGVAIGNLVLWVGKDGLVVKKTASGDEVGEIMMNGRFASPSGIPYALGDNVLGEDGVLFVKASFWRYQLDAIKKINPKKGMKLRISGKFVLNNFQKQDGTMGQNVTVNVQQFEVDYWGKNQNNNTETEIPEVTTAPEPEPKKGRKPAAPEVSVPF